jgi:hypothetical protein
MRHNPGHYVQFLHVNASDATKIEKMFASYCFRGRMGALHREDDDRRRVRRYRSCHCTAKFHLAQLGRIFVTLVVAYAYSVKTHCEGMSLADATKFIQETPTIPISPRTRKHCAGRYDPGYLSYTLGKLRSSNSEKTIRNRRARTSLCNRFHDTLLDHGIATG